MKLSWEKSFTCPYCGRQNIFLGDAAEGLCYTVETDCAVCCRPLKVSVRVEGENVSVDAQGG